MAYFQTAIRTKNRLVRCYLNYQWQFLDLFLRQHKSRLTAQEIRRGRVLVALLMFGLLACTAMFFIRLSTEGLTPATIVVFLGSVAILVGIVRFSKTGDSGASGDLLVITVIVIIFLTAYSDGGLYSRVLTWLPGLPLVANFTADRLTAIRTTLVVFVGLLLLLWFHEMQWIERQVLGDPLLGRLGASFGSMLFVSAIAYAYEDSRRRADEERESLSQTRNDWVSMVSHELRTPLTSLYGGLKLVVEGKLDAQPEKQKMLLNLSTRNTERLIYLVNDILDVERLSAGRFELNVRPIRLTDVVDEAVQTQRYLADERDIMLRVNGPSDAESSELSADYDRLLQVAQNLLSNAIKFSPRGSEVLIRLSASGGRVMCEVEDNGPGVSQEFAGQLFERFSQEESGDRRLSGGSGLGLFICRGIIQLHGGEIGYRPRISGGSIFYFYLPLVT